jgi:tripartite-type tricarboxylate transporter receptor subunit TctC
MKLPRRQFLQLAAGAAALPAMWRFASAQAYPARPIRLIAPFPAGGSIDLTARLIGQWLTERLGQQLVIENRSGAAGNIGSETAMNSPADGYTLLLCSVANAISATLYDKLNYNFRDVDAARLTCRLREADHRRNREMGQSDPRWQHQARVTTAVFLPTRVRIMKRGS